MRRRATMPNDDERRAVARRLRRQAEKLGPQMDAHEFANYTADVIDANECMTWYEMMLRLVDLIEPAPERTYHPERIGTAYHSALMCSACKYPLDDVTIYCPHCGARLEGVGR